MGDRGRDSRMDSLNALYDLKKNNPNDAATENNFYNAVLSYLLQDKTDHWWCNKALEPFVRESMMLFSLPEYDHITKYKNRMNKQLRTCRHCLTSYHNSKSALRQSYEQLYSVENVAQFFQQLERFDASRIHLTLQDILTPPSDPRPSSSSPIDTNEVICAIQDITISPAVLNVNNLDQEFSNAIMTMQNSTSLRIPELDMSPGLFSLTLHKNKIIRLFSRKQIERFTIRGQELDKQQADALKPFAKRLLTYLGSLNPTHSKAEVQPVDEPFGLTDQPGEYWKSFRYLSSCVAPPPLLIWIRSSPTNMESLIQSHLEDGSMWFHEVLKLLAVLLAKLKSQFWSSPPMHMSDFSKYIDSIFSNRVFRNLMQLLSQGNGRAVVHQNDGTPIPFEKVAIRLNGILEWIFPFWLSFTGTAIYVPMTENILDYMFNLFQQNNTPTLMRDKCVEIGMSIISEAIILDGRPSSAFINKYAALIVNYSIRFNSKKALDTKAGKEQQLLHQLLISDVNAVRDTFLNLYCVAPSKRSEPPKYGICEHIWKVVCSINFDCSIPAQMEVVTSVFKAQSVIALLDMDIMQDNQQQSESRQQQIQFLINSLMIIRTNVQTLLQALLDKQGSQLSKLMNNNAVASRALHIVASPDRDIRSVGVTIFKTAYREDAFIDCLIQYLRANPNNGLEAITQLMIDFNEYIDGGCNMFSASGPVFATLASVVSALVGNEDSLLFNVITSGELSTAGDLDKIQKLWSTFWICVGKSVKAALVWAQSYRPKEVVKTVLPVLQIASQVIGTFRTFEQIAQMKDASRENSTHWSSPSTSMLSYNELANALDPLSEWIFVTSHDVLRLLVPLLIMSLKRLTQTQVKVASNTYDRLMGAATGAAESRVTTDEKENMFMALSPHDPANTVFFDESDDEDNGNWVPADSNTNFSANFLDSSLLNVAQNESAPSISIASPPPISPKRLRQPTLAESFAAAVGKPPESSSKNTKNIRSQLKLTDFLAKPKADVIVLTDDDDTPKPVTATQVKGTNEEDKFDDEFDDEFEDMDFTDIPEEWFDEEKIRLENQKAFGESEEKLKAHRLERLRIAQANMHARKASRQNRVYVQQTTPTYAVGPSRGGLPGKKLRPPTMGLSKLQALRKEFTTARVYPSGTSTQHRREQGSQQDSDDSGDESAFAELVSDFDKSKESHAPKDKERFSGAIFDDRPRRSVKLIDAPITAGNNFQEKKAQMQRALARKKKVTPSMRGLHKTILAWDVTVEGEVPPNASRDMYKRVPSLFSDVHEYTQIFEPLLLLEVWMQLMRAKEEATESDVIDNCMIESRCNVDEFVDVTFQMTIASGRSLATDDLVFIANHFGSTFFNKSDGQHHKWVGKGFLSKVKSMVYKKDLADVTVRCYFPPSQMIMLNSLAPKSMWRALKLSSLTTAHREYSALKALEYYDLRDMILQPKHLPTASVTERELVRCMNTFKVNQPQAEAIMGTLRRPKGFTLIQGPPGTGKTKTILGLLASLISQQSMKNDRTSIQVPVHEQTTDLTGKLLICAPSNAAVDEIVKRVMQGIAGPEGKMFPKIVRIGKSESINSSVKDVCLEPLIEKEIQSLNLRKQASDKKGNPREKLMEEMRKIKLTLDELDKEMAQAEGDPVRYANINDRRRALMGKKRNLAVSLDEESHKRTEFSRDLEIAKQRAKQKILSEADIVSCTLSGSGHEMLTSIGISFETVIIDEAAQSIEISSLIPLKYDCQRCVLVGDPNQLPPTVLSQLASKYSYEQSLFVRLQKMAPDDVFLLSIQYRMHPEISLFPSKLFYESRLKDGPGLAELTKVEWHKNSCFLPYQFLNILDGKESMGSGKSLYNTKEAEAAVTLVDSLVSKFPAVNFAYRIGIITPYKQQLRELRNQFERQYGREILNVIDFNTVDGFQGQEKDIIIFSCVRAGHERGIGFLSDIRRMNVGLTRAKSSLFVLGHSQSLNGSEYWGDLVSDAKRRHLHIDCRLPLFGHRLRTGFHPPNLFKKALPTPAIIPPVVTSALLTSSRMTESRRSSIASDMDVDEETKVSTSNGYPTRTTVPEQRPVPRGNDASTTTEKADYIQTSLNRNKRGIEGIIDANSSSAIAPRKDNDNSGESRKLTLEEYRAKRAKMATSSRPADIRSSKHIPPPPSSSKPKPGLFIPKSKRPVADKYQPNEEVALSARERLTLQAEASRAELKRLSLQDREARKNVKSHKKSDSSSHNVLDDILDSISRT